MPHRRRMYWRRSGRGARARLFLAPSSLGTRGTWQVLRRMSVGWTYDPTPPVRPRPTSAQAAIWRRSGQSPSRTLPREIPSCEGFLATNGGLFARTSIDIAEQTKAEGKTRPASRAKTAPSAIAATLKRASCALARLNGSDHRTSRFGLIGKGERSRRSVKEKNRGHEDFSLRRCHDGAWDRSGDAASVLPRPLRKLRPLGIGLSAPC